MSGRPDREDALIIKAHICRTFHIGWTEYGQLTRREQRQLVTMMTPDAEQPAPHHKPPAPAGMERIV